MDIIDVDQASEDLDRSRVAAAGPGKTGDTALVAVLGALTAVASLSIDMNVPGLPSMASALHVGAAGIQLSMTALLLGLAAGQVLFGPVSDRLGRRGLIIAGSAGFTVLSVVCAVAPNIEILLAARLLQGICGAAGMVLARAVVTDRFAGRDIPKYFALLAQILGISPVAAPLIGGAVLSLSGWREIFIVLAVIGAAILAGVLAWLPESLPAERRHPQGLAGTFRSMGDLTRHRGFLGFAIVLGLCSAAMFAYIGESSFVFEDLHHVSPGFYSMIFAVNAVGAVAGGTAFGVLSRTARLNTLLVAATTIATAGAVLGLVVTLAFGDTLAGSWVTLFIVMTGIGMMIPAALSLGQGVGRHASGAASALLGGVQFTLGAVAAPLAGAFNSASSLPMVLVILVALLLAVVALVALVQPGRGHGEMH